MANSLMNCMDMLSERTQERANMLLLLRSLSDKELRLIIAKGLCKYPDLAVYERRYRKTQHPVR